MISDLDAHSLDDNTQRGTILPGAWLRIFRQFDRGVRLAVSFGVLALKPCLG